MGFNQACGFQSATCSTHTVTVLNVEMFDETFELHNLLVAEVFCKCFVDSDSSWAHARCLLKIPVIL